MIGGDITGSLGSIAKGDPGKSAYEIAVEHGYKGTEDEWINYIEANGNTAQRASESARVSANDAAASATAAANSAATALTYQTSAASYASSARESKSAAESAAQTANTAAGTATSDAAYIAGQIQGVLAAADNAGMYARNAATSATAAATSEEHARISEQNVALASTAIAANRQAAETAAQTATDKAAQATQIVTDFNANTELAHSYATIAGGHANAAQASAVSAADSANRAEEALGHALQPLENYYTKGQTDSLLLNVSASLTALSSSVNGDIDAVELRLTNDETNIAANHSAITLAAANHDTLNAKVVSADDTTEGLVKLYDEPGEATDGTMTQGAIKTGIDNVQNALLAHIEWAEHKITEVYKFKGSVQYYGNLPTSGMENGDVYNIRTGNKQAGINAGDNVAWVGEKTTYEHPTETTYDPDVTYYTDNTGTTEVDTTGFEEGVTDVSAYYVEVITPGEWDKLAGIFVLLPASSTELGGVKIGSHIDITVDGTISVADASSQTAGVLKLYSATGNNTDGTITQDAITTALAGKLGVNDNAVSATTATTATTALNIPTVAGGGNIWIA